MEKKMENEMETGVIQGLYSGYSILLGDTMVPNIEQDSILLLGHSILYKQCYLNRPLGETVITESSRV